MFVEPGVLLRLPQFLIVEQGLDTFEWHPLIGKMGFSHSYSAFLQDPPYQLISAWADCH